MRLTRVGQIDMSGSVQRMPHNSVAGCLPYRQHERGLGHKQVCTCKNGFGGTEKLSLTQPPPPAPPLTPPHPPPLRVRRNRTLCIRFGVNVFSMFTPPRPFDPPLRARRNRTLCIRFGVNVFSIFTSPSPIRLDPLLPRCLSCVNKRSK